MTSTLDYCRMLASVYQSFVKRSWRFTMTFQSDLQRWKKKTAGATLAGRWRRGGGGLGMFSRGWWAWKPEDPGYLLLLAAPRTKRGLNTFFFFPVWLQTMRGFESTHDSHGNWFQVPTIKWNWCFFFLKNGSKLKHTGSVERDHF